MGTTGGKIGFVVGALVAFAVSAEMVHLVLGSCFFEEGCPNEAAGLVAAAVASLLIGSVAGLVLKSAVNRLLKVDR